MKTEKLLRVDVVPEDYETILDKMKCRYVQECDLNENDYQELRVSIRSHGTGNYFVIKTKRWTFDSIDELIKVLNDFKTRLNDENRNI